MAKLLGLGQAIEWMMRNPRKWLRDSDSDFWCYDGDQCFVLDAVKAGERSEDANICLPFMLEHIFVEAQHE